MEPYRMCLKCGVFDYSMVSEWCPNCQKKYPVRQVTLRGKGN